MRRAVRRVQCGALDLSHVFPALLPLNDEARRVAGSYRAAAGRIQLFASVRPGSCRAVSFFAAANSRVETERDRRVRVSGIGRDANNVTPAFGG
jgi:hypothetical protein